MTTDLYLEFDEGKYSLLKREAYDLDLNLETYLSEMIEDMISFNKDKTEDEQNMEAYKEYKWKMREPESTAIERFQERWWHFISQTVDEYKCIDENEEYSEYEDYLPKNMENCIRYVMDECSEVIEDEMEFPCTDLIKKTVLDAIEPSEMDINKLINVEVNIYFEIHNSILFGGKGSIGYTRNHFDECKNFDHKNINDEFINQQIESNAALFNVDKSDVHIISKQKYDEKTSDEDENE